MYNELDSRALGRTDCYAQRFMRPGEYQYNVVPGHAQALSTDFPFRIHVEEGKKKSKMAQHNVFITPNGKGFAVEPAELTINIGDLVLWNGGGNIPFAVVGDKEFFNSHRMLNECGFSHAFGKAGNYHWRDAFGSNISGLVRVHDPNCGKDSDLRKWRETLSQGNVVMIADGKVDKAEIDIATGQTVFFAIVQTPGISITDDRLLDNVYNPPCAS